MFRLLLFVAGNLRGAFVIWAHAWPYIGWLGPVTIGLLCAAFARMMVVRLSSLAQGSGVQNVEVRRCRWAPLFSVLLSRFLHENEADTRVRGAAGAGARLAKHHLPPQQEERCYAN